MPTIISGLEGASGLQIEVEQVGGGGSAPRLVDVRGAIVGIANSIASAVTQMPAAERPSEVVTKFFLKALDTGGFAIGAAGGNFEITMKWGGGVEVDQLVDGLNVSAASQVR